MLTSEVENYPALNGHHGPDDGEFEQQARRFGTEMVAEDVIAVDFSQRPFYGHDRFGAKFEAETILIATGASAKWLGLPNEPAAAGTWRISLCGPAWLLLQK